MIDIVSIYKCKGDLESYLTKSLPHLPFIAYSMLTRIQVRYVIDVIENSELTKEIIIALNPCKYIKKYILILCTD